MKTLKTLLFTVCTLLAVACNNRKNSSVPGVYVTAFKQEFSIVNDTLVIEPFNIESRTYRVSRNSGYHRIRERKILPKEFERENWMATFDEDKQVLQQTEFGKQIYINIKAGTVSFGATYHKIK
jgi:hypothetical protein